MFKMYVIWYLEKKVESTKCNNITYHSQENRIQI